MTGTASFRVKENVRVLRVSTGRLHIVYDTREYREMVGLCTARLHYPGLPWMILRSPADVYLDRFVREFMRDTVVPHLCTRCYAAAGSDPDLRALADSFQAVIEKARLQVVISDAGKLVTRAEQNFRSKMDDLFDLGDLLREYGQELVQVVGSDHVSSMTVAELVDLYRGCKWL